MPPQIPWGAQDDSKEARISGQATSVFPASMDGTSPPGRPCSQNWDPSPLQDFSGPPDGPPPDDGHYQLKVPKTQVAADPSLVSLHGE